MSTSTSFRETWMQDLGCVARMGECQYATRCTDHSERSRVRLPQRLKHVIAQIVLVLSLRAMEPNAVQGIVV